MTARLSPAEMSAAFRRILDRLGPPKPDRRTAEQRDRDDDAESQAEDAAYWRGIGSESDVQAAERRHEAHLGGWE